MEFQRRQLNVYAWLEAGASILTVRKQCDKLCWQYSNIFWVCEWVSVTLQMWTENHSSVLQARRYRSVFHILYCTKLSRAASSIHPHHSNGVTLDVSCADVDHKIQWKCCWGWVVTICMSHEQLGCEQCCVRTAGDKSLITVKEVRSWSGCERTARWSVFMLNQIFNQQHFCHLPTVQLSQMCTILFITVMTN